MRTTQDAKRNNIETATQNRRKSMEQLRKEYEAALDRTSSALIKAGEKYANCPSEETEEALKDAMQEREDVLAALNRIQEIEAKAAGVIGMSGTDREVQS